MAHEYLLGFGIRQSSGPLFLQQDLTDHLHTHIPGFIQFLGNPLRPAEDHTMKSPQVWYYQITTNLTPEMILAMPTQVRDLEFTLEAFYSMHNKLPRARALEYARTHIWPGPAGLAI